MTTTAQRVSPNKNQEFESAMLKCLIIHTTDVDRTREFERKLRRSPEFVNSYDGWEQTATRTGTVISHRLYCYDLTSENVLKILKHLHKFGKTGGFAYKVKINPIPNGNHNFD